MAEDLVAELAKRLDARAGEATRTWWNRYLKGAIEFRGVPMAGVREVVHGLWRERELDERPREDQLRVVLALFAQPYAEDKLAAILVLGERLLDDLGAPDVPFLAEPFRRGHVADWSTCDWYCVKVLARLLERAPDAAEAIAAWHAAPNLWQRRAAAVSFVRLARHGDARLPNLTGLVLEVCAANVRDPQRFSQTSVGWVLRELSHAEPAVVAAFVDEHSELMST
ncbi:MAG: DNA alkylation repair protein, partial [Actinomycetota bacterium]|nr:DNA alkylation repair protein [Actinomycetota bacterium]